MWSPRPVGRSTDCKEFWDRTTKKLEELGTSGLETISTKKSTHTITYRDEEGVLLGVLWFYPKGNLPAKNPGEVEVVVHPDHRRHGIGMLLIKEAIRLWDIQAKKQRYNPASAALTESWLEEYRANRLAKELNESMDDSMATED